MIDDVAKWVQPLSLAHEGKEHQYKVIKPGENNYETIKIPEYLVLYSSLASLCSSQFSLILPQPSNSAVDSYNFDTPDELFYRVDNIWYQNEPFEFVDFFVP
jgi:hypothetical protein